MEGTAQMLWYLAKGLEHYQVSIPAPGQEISYGKGQIKKPLHLSIILFLRIHMQILCTPTALQGL